MLDLDQISMEYSNKKVTTKVLSDLKIHVDEGEFVMISGKSGSGKSTLLSIIGLLERPTFGTYTLDGERLSDISEKKKATLRNKKLGFVFQSFHLLPELTVLDNVCEPLGYAGIGKRERRKRGEDLLEQVGILDKRRNHPSQLSGGEKQRTAIARALINRPRLLLADEPTGNLDTENSELIMKLLLKLHKEGTTILMVTHDQNLLDFGSRTIVLSDGRVKSDKQSASGREED